MSMSRGASAKAAAAAALLAVGIAVSGCGGPGGGASRQMTPQQKAAMENMKSMQDRMQANPPTGRPGGGPAGVSSPAAGK